MAASTQTYVQPLERRMLMSFQPEGDPLRMNETSNVYDYAPDVAMDANGDFVAVWQSTDGRSTGKVLARRFDRNGRPRTGDILVTPEDARWGGKPDVSTDARGNFVVAWLGVAADGMAGMYARLFDPRGRPQTGAIAIDPGGEPTPGHGGEIASAMSDDGSRFFVAWREMDDRELPPEVPRHPSLPPGTVLRGQVTRGRLFNGDGAPMGDAFTVHASDERTSRKEISAAMDADGDLVVAWQHFGLLDRLDGVFVRRFDRAGNPITGDVLASTPGDGDEQNHPSVAMQSDGDFLISWRDERGSGATLLARPFSADGTPAGGPTVIASYAAPTYSPVAADVATDDDGNFLASWREDNGVFARHFDAAGKPRGAVMNLGTGNNAFPMQANVATDRQGRYAAVVWGRNDIVDPAPGADRDENVYAQLLRDPERDPRAAAASRLSVRQSYVISRRRDFRPRALSLASAAPVVGG